MRRNLAKKYSILLPNGTGKMSTKVSVLLALFFERLSLRIGQFMNLR